MTIANTQILEHLAQAKDVYSQQELAKLLGVTERTIRRGRSPRCQGTPQGRIPHR